MSLKEAILSLKNDFININKEIDSMKEINEKQEDIIYQEISKLKLEMELLRKNNLLYKMTIQTLSDYINGLSSFDNNNSDEENNFY
ncbi:hypothetical protein RB653_000638 [Dictyostelium firmibasis]|uniref:Uncharacterized protein n=1 Tax=Dictyostelium firmibasis TaxID=79012 RepID=A0AAN7U3M9_9MYCE